MIPVTKPYLPKREKLSHYIDGIYQRSWLTNQGPLVEELTRRLEDYLGLDNLLLVANGTLALQIAYQAVEIAGGQERVAAITTPFSFIATTSSLRWENIEPTYVDIEPRGWCLDPLRVEEALGQRTFNRHILALVPVHVFGNACDVDALAAIAERYGLKLIYDGAHAFGVKYRGTSLLRYGDASTLSFHATKLFHTIEGGAITFRRKEHLERARRMINFGSSPAGGVEALGINAKMNEFQAAMGLCILDDIDEIMERRAEIWNRYRSGLQGVVEFQEINKECEINCSYFPVVFESERMLISVKSELEEAGMCPRRYFYPSLDILSGVPPHDAKANSRAVSERVLCLPIYPDMTTEDVRAVIDNICRVMK
ncbi:DegT/DnrJ/EryC1/StrS family aminotransferase [Halomonas kalidii]|uniref:DegT/DnrJ/EryC1/StrS family aminotransferase n=1 Tax=Halomonas kalidii TaxID=3043293 RepID=A0ABT6VKP4_9GAMM|nr:DegT/DnrJ/EryC1/StrS family aminotransferase [Halomonas kalidii]MDI5934144.1 DegT/DnrJ/EryC1/StrS family aminotransferase [Halomonas kalidii]